MIDLINVLALAEGGQLTSQMVNGRHYCRWLPEWEVEAKFQIDHASIHPSELLWMIVAPHKPLIVDKVSDGNTVVYPCYLTESTTEYSFFEYGGRPLVKIKTHSVERSGEIPVMVSTESFMEDDEALRWHQTRAVEFVGPLEKARSKVYLHDLASATCYSAAVTVCHFNSMVQRQFELEYHSSHSRIELTSVRELVERVRLASAQVQLISRAKLTATTETKLEFLQNAAANAYVGGIHR